MKDAMERLQQAKIEAEEAARRSMEIAQKAAEEAKKQADKVEEQTRPTREKIGGGMRVVGGIAKRVVDNPLVRGTAEIGMKAAETILDVHEVIDKKSKAMEDKIAASSVAKKVRKSCGESRPRDLRSPPLHRAIQYTGFRTYPVHAYPDASYAAFQRPRNRAPGHLLSHALRPQYSPPAADARKATRAGMKRGVRARGGGGGGCECAPARAPLPGRKPCVRAAPPRDARIHRRA